jgi:hypothetical protein
VTGAQRIERHARRHRGEPACRIVDGFGVTASEPQPRLLHGMVRIGAAAEDAKSEFAQVVATLFEFLGQPLAMHDSLTNQLLRPAHHQERQ